MPTNNANTRKRLCTIIHSNYKQFKYRTPLVKYAVYAVHILNQGLGIKISVMRELLGHTEVSLVIFPSCDISWEIAHLSLSFYLPGNGLIQP